MEIQERDGEVVFAVRVTPRASRDAIEGEYQGALKVRLTAPPVDDRANDALRRLLAARLNVPVSAVRILAGVKSRTKRVAVTGAKPCVFRIKEMEAVLANSFSADAIKHIVINPQGLSADIHATPEYRAHLIGVMAQRAVASAASARRRN